MPEQDPPIAELSEERRHRLEEFVQLHPARARAPKTS